MEHLRPGRPTFAPESLTITLQNDPGADVDGIELNVESYHCGSIQIIGCINAKVVIETSNTGVAGDWTIEATIDSTDGITTVLLTQRFLRTRIQDYIAGTIVVTAIVK